MTRLMDLQNKQDNLFKAFQKSENPEIKEIFADKWRNISRIIQDLSYEQAKADIQDKKDHICKAMGIKIITNKKGFSKVYTLDNKKVFFGELIEKWGMK